MRFKKRIEEDEVAPNRTLVAKERKLKLEQTCAIRCGRCPYHKGENTSFRSPNADIRKKKKLDKKRRETIRGKR